MRQLFILLLGILALLILGYFCTNKLTSSANLGDGHPINSITIQDNPHLNDVSIVPQGNKATLIGHVELPEHKETAEKIAKEQGYFSIDNKIVVDTPSSSPQKKSPQSSVAVKDNKISLSLSESGELKMTGSVPNQGRAVRLMELAYDKYGVSNVETELVETTKTTDAIADVTESVLKYIPMLNSAKATIDNQNIHISGQTYSNEDLSEFKSHINDLSPKGYQTKFDISIIEKEPEDEQALSLAKSCQSNINHLLKKQKINFEPSSSKIIKNSHTVLEQLALLTQRCPVQKIIIEGHTDSSGNKNHNLTLSQKRAEAVLNFLAKKGVNKDHFLTIGYGSSKPIADNTTKQGRARNRRIEFNVQGI